MKPGLLVALLCSLPALAQQQKVLPAGMDFVEGPLVFTYPFGRATAAIQLLYDADQVTQGQGVIFGMRFRQSQVSGSQTHAGYTKDYQVTAYTVSTSAAAMAADPALNIGTATGTIVFQGPLTLPPINPLTIQPAPFAIDLPFSQPYAYDGSQGNLLLVVETFDTAPVTSGYRIDGVNLTFANVTGLSADIDPAGCVVQGQSLTLTVPEANAIVGGSIVQNFAASATGAFPVVLAALSLDARHTDLTTFGMPGCVLHLAHFEFQFIPELTGGGYAPLTWNLPNAPWLEGIALASQGMGLAPSGMLGDSVVSNAIGTRLGGSAGPTNNMGMSFRTTGSWSMSNNGVFMAVVALDGVFP